MSSNRSIDNRGRTVGLICLACAVAAMASGCMSMGDRSPSARAEVVEGDRPVPERAARAYESAKSAMQAEDWLTAALELEQLVDDYPQFPGPYVNLAIVYRNDGREQEAISVLESALEIAPHYAPANNELGIMLRAQGEFEQAEAAYRRAIEGDAAYAPAYYNLGILLDLYMGRQAEALEQYQSYQALANEPDPQIELWIVDLERRVRVSNENERVAQGEGP